jgi:hypothetical protein
MYIFLDLHLQLRPRRPIRNTKTEMDVIVRDLTRTSLRRHRFALFIMVLYDLICTKPSLDVRGMKIRSMEQLNVSIEGEQEPASRKSVKSWR